MTHKQKTDPSPLDTAVITLYMEGLLELKATFKEVGEKMPVYFHNELANCQEILKC